MVGTMSDLFSLRFCYSSAPVGDCTFGIDMHHQASDDVSGTVWRVDRGRGVRP
jgi:hypothetical protein